MKKTGSWSWSQTERDGEVKNSQGQQGTERGEGKNKGYGAKHRDGKII